MVRLQFEIRMLLKMRTPKEKNLKKSKSQQCQKKYLTVIFGEKFEKKRSQAKSNLVKVEEN